MNSAKENVYYIPSGYVPILINKSLFKNAAKAVRKLNNINIPLYILEDFDIKIKKPPNAFIIYRSEIYKHIKNEYPNATSRKLSQIIGNMWNNQSEENKSYYIKKANAIKKKHNKIYPRYKYNKVMKNLKQRKYIKKKEIDNNPQLLMIKNFLFNMHKM
jgi:sRNA-binding carbon storage regulator CsrA